mmetsp:Transcript_22271/g.38851  ORF Transcript_22271/g.38851 Transcript_22271/m.38851 type:complete len:294 (-) Transcript_22271:509-1390(-)
MDFLLVFLNVVLTNFCPVGSGVEEPFAPHIGTTSSILGAVVAVEREAVEAGVRLRVQLARRRPPVGVPDHVPVEGAPEVRHQRQHAQQVGRVRALVLEEGRRAEAQGPHQQGVAKHVRRQQPPAGRRGLPAGDDPVEAGPPAPAPALPLGQQEEEGVRVRGPPPQPRVRHHPHPQEVDDVLRGEEGAGRGHVPEEGLPGGRHAAPARVRREAGPEVAVAPQRGPGVGRAQAVGHQGRHNVHVPGSEVLRVVEDQAWSEKQASPDNDPIVKCECHRENAWVARKHEYVQHKQCV